MKMNDAQILREMFAPQALVEQQGRTVVLDEDKCEDSQLTVRKLPKDAFAIKFVPWELHNAFLSDKHHQLRTADYAIIDPAKKRISIIELKKGKADNLHIVHQLRGSLCLMEYCRKLGIEFWYQKELFRDWNYRFIATVQTSLAKASTQLRKEGINSREFNRGDNVRPEKFRTFIAHAFIHYNQIVRNKVKSTRRP